MLEIIAVVLIIIGITFDMFGSIGLIRLPDVYNRLQASTKCITLGTCSILLGVFLLKGFSAAGVKALMCMVFLLLTAPVSAHALAKAAHAAGIKPWHKGVCDKYEQDKKQLGAE